MEKLTLSHVHLSYGGRPILKDISLVVPERSVTAFIGPSGCGKSTLLKTMNRMTELTKDCETTGRIALDGEDIKDLPLPLLRRRVGMVFQKPTPFPMSIYDNIAYGPRTHGIKDKSRLDEIVENALKDSGLFDEVKDRLTKSALSLSGGQQQRLCIARALAVCPEVLLMDEPTSALDPISTARIEELILRLKERYAILIVTHNMQQAQRIANDTAFLYMGELVECAPTKELFSSPRHQRTKDYVAGHFG